MKTDKITLNIPTAILSLDANPSEKLLLSLYLQNSSAKNNGVRKALSITAEGLKKVKRRLIARGWLRVIADGYMVTVPGLEADAIERDRNLVSKSDTSQKANKVALPVKVKTAEEIVRQHNELFDSITSRPCFSVTLLRAVERTLAEIQSDLPEGLAKTELLKEFTNKRDRMLALYYGHSNLPRPHHAQWDRLVFSASPAQLAKLRDRVEQHQLAGKKPALLLQQFTTGPAGFQAS